MPCAAEPNGTLTSLPLRSESSKYGESLWTTRPLPEPNDAVGRDRDEPALAFRIALEGEAVHHQRIVAHHAELKLVRHHAVGDRRAGGEVVPLELELDVGVLAVLRQVLLQQLELADDGAGGDRVGRGVLRADPDRDDRLRARRRPASRKYGGDGKRDEQPVSGPSSLLIMAPLRSDSGSLSLRDAIVSGRRESWAILV